MHKERLEQMVVMLRSLPKEGLGFNIGMWNCGTTACAVGHACLNPVFQEQGLAWNKRWGEPEFARKTSWSAVEDFFSLSTDQAERLFYEMSYPDGGDHTTAADVADRIEAFIAA